MTGNPRRPAKANPTNAQAKRDLSVSLNELAWLMATSWDSPIRDGKKAIALATRACELTEWKNPYFLDTLASAHAETGQFDEAIKRQNQALELAKDSPAAVLEVFKQHLKLYEAHTPYHEPKPVSPTSPAPDRAAPK